jgi:hypothetical protein
MAGAGSCGDRTSRGAPSRGLLNGFGGLQVDAKVGGALFDAGQNPEPVLLKDAYYQIQDAETEEIVVDFSTGSVKYSKLSYDKDGNYFLLDTNSLRPEYVYKIKIMMNWADQIQIFDRDLLFKIEL